MELKSNQMIVKNCELVSLQNRIHKQNVEMGWWDEPRSPDVFACLFHSELSEAMEGDRKGLMDDHLTHYQMFEVEIADFVIRCLDWLGKEKCREYEAATVPDGCTNTQLIAHLHNMVSEFFVNELKGMRGIAENYLSQSVSICFAYMGAELIDIINEKVEYNKHRADHKRENRQLEGGKKY